MTSADKQLHIAETETPNTDLLKSLISYSVSFKALLLSKLHVALVQVALWVNVGLVLSSFGLADVDVGETELVLQAAHVAEAVLTKRTALGRSRPSIYMFKVLHINPI